MSISEFGQLHTCVAHAFVASCVASVLFGYHQKLELINTIKIFFLAIRR
jgi:hypothetical protein